MADQSSRRGYCLCCRIERAHLTSQAQVRIQICRVCQLHQDDDRAGWIKRDKHHRQMWAGNLAEAEGAYLDELLTLEREASRLRDVLDAAGISSAVPDPTAPARARIRELHEQSITTPETIASLLTDEGFKPPHSKRWTGTMVIELVAVA